MSLLGKMVLRGVHAISEGSNILGPINLFKPP